MASSPGPFLRNGSLARMAWRGPGGPVCRAHVGVSAPPVRTGVPVASPPATQLVPLGSALPAPSGHMCFARTSGPCHARAISGVGLDGLGGDTSVPSHRVGGSKMPPASRWRRPRRKVAAHLRVHRPSTTGARRVQGRHRSRAPPKGLSGGARDPISKRSCHAPHGLRYAPDRELGGPVDRENRARFTQLRSDNYGWAAVD